MIIDAAYEFADRQALEAGTTYSTNTIDRGSHGVGQDGAPELSVIVNVHAISSGYVEATLEHSDDGSSWAVFVGSGKATSVKTVALDMKLPAMELRRHLRVKWVATGDATVSAALVRDAYGWRAMEAR